MESVDPASVNSCTGCTNSAAEDVCAFFEDTGLERFFTIHATAASNDNVSIFDFNAFAAQFDEFDEFGHEVSIGEVSFLFDNFASCRRICFRFFEDVRADSTHLRTVVRADDFSHDVAAESRTGPYDGLLVVVNAELCAVSGEASLQGVSDTRAEVTANVGSANEEYVRFFFMEEIANNFCISRRIVMFELRIIINVYFMSTVSDEFLSQRFYVFTNEDCTDFVADGVSQDASLAQQFERYIT